jgi:hypothetical protein
MTARVELERLAAALDDYSNAYLMTTDAQGRPHAGVVATRLEGECLYLDGWGRRSRDNLLARPAVALVYPPADAGGYSLIVDGNAKLRAGKLSLTPTAAVLHRPPGPDGPAAGSACSGDCQRLDRA